MTKNAPIEDVVGIIPAGGHATRLSPLPLSKEIYPVGFQKISGCKGVRPKVVSQYLLEKMHYAGVRNIFIVLRKGKWDIPTYLGHDGLANQNIAYLIMNHSYGVPFTVDQAYPFVNNATVALGFPDIFFDKQDAFSQLLNRLSISKADLVLGLFPIKRPEKWDMVDFKSDGTIKRLLIKSKNHRLPYGWAIAVWTPTFSEYMHAYLSRILLKFKPKNDAGKRPLSTELYFGDIIQEAINDKLVVDSVTFPNSNCIDIGTPADMVMAINTIEQLSAE